MLSTRIQQHLNKTYGKLKVVEIRQSLKSYSRKSPSYQCRVFCSICGKESQEWQGLLNIVGGRTQSCGCLRHTQWFKSDKMMARYPVKNGDTCGALVVIDDVPFHDSDAPPGSSRAHTWLIKAKCMCCGDIINVKRAKFFNGGYKACGKPLCNPDHEEKLKIHLAGQLREVFFIAGYRSSSGSALTTYLRTHPKCIVLMPSEIGVARLGTSSENFVVAIESFAFLDGGNINVQRDVLEKRIAYFFGDSKPKTRPKRRESRLGDIEALELEFTEHLRAARDYAVTTRDMTGTPKLLPRPTRDEFAKRAGVSASSVTRCMGDPAGWKLQRMWQIADDLDAIIGYRED